ncbi:MAG: apolipoprotein N-acyltransferase [Chlamydiae bacterium]|nr:apolipoprotein N-acyltransferase [Chlamydiota bacterium]
MFYLSDRVKTPEKSCLWWTLTGLALYLASAAWLSQVTVIGTLLLSLILAFYFGVFGWFSKKICPSHPLGSILFLSSLWSFLEYLRTLGSLGFPWFFLGYSQSQHLPLIQMVSWGGESSLSFLIFFINRSLYEILFPKNLSISKKIVLGFICIILVAGNYFYGMWRLAKAHSLESKGPVLKVTVVQGNIPQSEKWDIKEERSNFRRYTNLTLRAARSHPDLIVWPETALPGNLKTERHLQRKMSKLAHQVGAYLLVGGEDDRLYPQRVVTNTAFLLNSDGQIVGQYDKIHLVPCGEYVPLRKWIPWVANMTLGEIDFSGGQNFKVFEINGIHFSSVICFEDIFPGHVRKFILKGAELMINLTNDAWFGISRSAEEHLNLARFSSVANGVGLVRATNTGVSAFISPYGEILGKVQNKEGDTLEIEGFKSQEMRVERVKTLYAQYGDFFAWIYSLMVALFLVISKIKIQKSK